VKYIVLRDGDREWPLLFPNELSHLHMADLFAPAPVAAAGFVREGPDGIACWGESVGLRIASRYQVDAALISGALGED
jgi:hypothetical protein